MLLIWIAVTMKDITFISIFPLHNTTSLEHVMAHFEVSFCLPLVLTQVLQTPIENPSLGIFIHREKVMSH